MSNETIEAAAAQVVGAKERAAVTGDALAAVTSRRDGLKARIDALTAERGTIVAARKAGNTDPEHGPRLALIGADLEGLGEIMADADAEVAKAKAADDAARHVVTLAEQGLANERDDEMLGRMKAHADKLGVLMLAAVDEITAISKRMRLSREPWHPEPKLAATLHRLD